MFEYRVNLNGIGHYVVDRARRLEFHQAGSGGYSQVHFALLKWGCFWIPMGFQHRQFPNDNGDGWRSQYVFDTFGYVWQGYNSAVRDKDKLRRRLHRTHTFLCEARRRKAMHYAAEAQLALYFYGSLEMYQRNGYKGESWPNDLSVVLPYDGREVKLTDFGYDLRYDTCPRIIPP